MTNLLRLFAVALVFGLASSGCGQKGPLFLPGNPSEIRPEAPEQEENNEEEDETGQERPR